MCKALCVNASLSKYGETKIRKLSKKRTLNANRGKFYKFC